MWNSGLRSILIRLTTIGDKHYCLKAVVVPLFAEWALTTSEVHGSNPNIDKLFMFIWQVHYMEKSKIKS